MDTTLESQKYPAAAIGRPTIGLECMPHRISPEASKAARLMLDRLRRLSAISDGGSVETTILSVPENRREHVLSVLEALSGRGLETNTEDPLASAARLVRNAALELWAKSSHDEAESKLDRQASRLTTH
jgi:hypothetical protein